MWYKYSSFRCFVLRDGRKICFIEKKKFFFLVFHVERSVITFATTKPGPKVIKLFYAHLAQHQIYPAKKSQIASNCKFFVA